MQSTHSKASVYTSGSAAPSLPPDGAGEARGRTLLALFAVAVRAFVLVGVLSFGALHFCMPPRRPPKTLFASGGVILFYLNYGSPLL